MKPKRQEDSSCVFAYYFVAALAIAAIPQEKQASRGKHAIQGFPPAAVYHFCGDTPEMAFFANG